MLHTLATRLVNELVEVADNKTLACTIARYGRIGLNQAVPHPATLKPTTRCGSTAVDGLNEALLASGRRDEATAHKPAAGRHHGGSGQRGLTRPTPAWWEGYAADRCDRPADPGSQTGNTPGRDVNATLAGMLQAALVSRQGSAPTASFSGASPGRGSGHGHGELSTGRGVRLA